MFLGRAEEASGRREGAATEPARPADVPWWQSTCPPPQPPRAVGPGDRMVREVDRRHASGFYPYVFLAAADAWAGRDKEAKDAAAQLQKVYPASPCRRGPESTGPTIRPSKRNFSASRKACARRACRRERRRRINRLPRSASGGGACSRSQRMMPLGGPRRHF